MNYNYLKNTKAPKVFVEAYKLIGIKETLGKDNNPTILKWADELGLKNTYTADEIPWCGLFVAYVCHKADKEVVKNPLWARNWNKYGTQEVIAMFGDILVFERGANSGHVGIYVGEDDKCYHVLGGNQGDQVSIVRIPKARCIGIRRTKWSVAQPSEVRVIKLNSEGLISDKED
tara:strand:+ start:1028 stop:1549 length:522 start_codon:yes stop_codon:yes gene_type:complete